MSIENENPENENANPETNSAENQHVEGKTETLHSESDSETEKPETEITEEDFSHLSIIETLDEMEKIVNKDDTSSFSRRFSGLRDHANHKIADETEDKKHDYLEQGNPEEHFEFHHPESSRLSALVHIFREKQDKFHKQQEAEHHQNLEERLAIIERLKNLYTSSEPGVNLFKAIREIKEAWGNAGQVAKSEFKNLNNNYFHHLKMFNEMLDLNKEYLEQEFAHNLEKR